MEPETNVGDAVVRGDGRRWDRLTRFERGLMIFYGSMALVALVATWWNNIDFFSSPEHGGVTGYIEDGFANPAAASLAFDVLFVAVVAQVFMVVEGRRVGMSYRALGVFVVAGAMVAIAVAFPTFLIARQVHVSNHAP